MCQLPFAYLNRSEIYWNDAVIMYIVINIFELTSGVFWGKSMILCLVTGMILWPALKIEGCREAISSSISSIITFSKFCSWFSRISLYRILLALLILFLDGAFIWIGLVEIVIMTGTWSLTVGGPRLIR